MEWSQSNHCINFALECFCKIYCTKRGKWMSFTRTESCKYYIYIVKNYMQICVTEIDFSFWLLIVHYSSDIVAEVHWRCIRRPRRRQVVSDILIKWCECFLNVASSNLSPIKVSKHGANCYICVQHSAHTLVSNSDTNSCISFGFRKLVMAPLTNVFIKIIYIKLIPIYEFTLWRNYLM